MSMNAGWALQKGIFATLSNSSTVTSLLGGANIFDDVPQAAGFPYVTFGRSTSRDWSSSTEDGEEHILTLHVWSQGNGKKQTQEIIGELRNTLHGTDIALDQHHLVNLRHEFSDARRDPDGESYHGIVRYRAVTEPV